MKDPIESKLWLEHHSYETPFYPCCPSVRLNGIHVPSEVFEAWLSERIKAWEDAGWSPSRQSSTNLLVEYATVLKFTCTVVLQGRRKDVPLNELRDIGIAKPDPYPLQPYPLRKHTVIFEIQSETTIIAPCYSFRGYGSSEKIFGIWVNDRIHAWRDAGWGPKLQSPPSLLVDGSCSCVFLLENVKPNNSPATDKMLTIGIL